MILHYQRPNDMAKLADELWQSGLVPVLIGGVSTVMGLGDDITITVPDGADEAAIAAVVAKHDPTPRAQAPTIDNQIAALQQAVLSLALGGF